MGCKQVQMQTRGALQHTQTPALDQLVIGTKLFQILTIEFYRNMKANVKKRQPECSKNQVPYYAF